jgi:hypothetical protein
VLTEERDKAMLTLKELRDTLDQVQDAMRV